MPSRQTKVARKVLKATQAPRKGKAGKVASKMTPAKMNMVKLALQRGGKPGTYSYRRKDMKALDIAPGSNQFEMEHAVGYKVLAPALARTGGEGDDKEMATKIEAYAGAYHEVLAYHRAHLGTGNVGPIEGEAVPSMPFASSDQYRHDQRETLVPTPVMKPGPFGSKVQSMPAAAPSVSNALQLNQLGYAHNPDFQTAQRNESGAVIGHRALTRNEKKSDESYNTMLHGGFQVGFTHGADNENVSTLHATPQDSAEAYLARQTARTGAYPTRAQENEARELFGLPRIADTDPVDDVEMGTE